MGAPSLPPPPGWSRVVREGILFFLSIEDWTALGPASNGVEDEKCQTHFLPNALGGWTMVQGCQNHEFFFAKIMHFCAIFPVDVTSNVLGRIFFFNASGLAPPGHPRQWECPVPPKMAARQPQGREAGPDRRNVLLHEKFKALGGLHLSEFYQVPTDWRPRIVPRLQGDFGPRFGHWGARGPSEHR